MPGHGERRLGDVGGEHDAPAVAGREDALLLGHRQPREQRQDLDLRAHRGAARGRGAAGRRSRGSRARRAGTRGCRPGPRATGPRPCRRSPPPVPPRRRPRSATRRRRAVGLPQRPVAHVDREHAARHLDHRRRLALRAEMPREALGVERGRRDDHLEVGPRAQQLPQVAQQEVDVEAALVRLVDDDRVVGGELRGRPASPRAGCRRSSA